MNESLSTFQKQLQLAQGVKEKYKTLIEASLNDIHAKQTKLMRWIDLMEKNCELEGMMSDLEAVDEPQDSEVNLGEIFNTMEHLSSIHDAAIEDREEGKQDESMWARMSNPDGIRSFASSAIDWISKTKEKILPT